MVVKLTVAAVITLILLIGLFFLFSHVLNNDKLSNNQLAGDFNKPSLLPMPSLTLTPTLTPTPTPLPKYPLHQDIPATIFWVGEVAGRENDFISNEISYWDKNWIVSFGGIDDPANRNGYFPAAFKPKQNPFYFALPYGEFERGRNLKQNTANIPWYRESLQTGVSLIKNRWIKIIYKDKECFGQWEDVGPGETDDMDYVFGHDFPINDFSGIDLSPAVGDCLGMNGRAKVSWHFVDFEDVPTGPWKQIITGN